MSFRVLVLIPLVAATLGGCSVLSVDSESRAQGGSFNPGLWSSKEARGSADVEGAAPPIAALPAAAGRVVGVRERRLANGLTQQIALAGDAGVRGENLIEVTLRTDAEGNSYQNLVEMPGDSAEEIETELNARFPGTSMRMHDAVLRNAYGPYGLATGAMGRANCVYLWQTIANLDGGGRRSILNFQPKEGAVRVRLCRVGVSTSQLAQWAAGLMIGSSGYAAPAPGLDLLAGRGDPLAQAQGGAYAGGYAAGGYPAGGYAASRFDDGGFQGYAGPPPEAQPARVAAAPSRAARRVVRRKVVYVRAEPEPATKEAAAPAAPAPVAQPAAPAPVIAAPATMMAPQQGFAAPGQPIWTQPGAAAFGQSSGYGGMAAPTVQRPLSGSASGPLGLPPQAYTGPSSAGYTRAPITR